MPRTSRLLIPDQPTVYHLIAEAEPLQFICLSRAFGGNDPPKTNAVPTFAVRTLGRDKVNR